jgi:DNA modification methylase
LGHVVERSSVSLAFTSPPYPGVDEPEPEYGTFPDPKDFNAAHAILAQVWKCCFDALEDTGRLVVNLYDIPTGAEGMYPNVAATIKNCLAVGFILRETFIWHKGASYSPPSGSWPYPKGVLSANTYEPLLVFQKPLQFSQRKKDTTDYPIDIREASKLGKEEHGWLMDPVWKISAEREGRKLGHPFTFPEELAERFIKLYTFKGERVLDPFLGSGTTVKAAEKLGREGIGFELSDKYISICKKRLQNQALF